MKSNLPSTDVQSSDQPPAQPLPGAVSVEESKGTVYSTFSLCRSKVKIEQSLGRLDKRLASILFSLMTIDLGHVGSLVVCMANVSFFYRLPSCH